MIISIIPAKAFSSGIPGKNLVDLAGKPLVQWTIEASLKSNVDNTYVMSDSEVIKSLADSMNLGILREPSKSSRQGEHVVYAILKVLDQFDPQDSIVLLLPTSPLRNFQHINEAIRLHETTKENVVSTTKAPPLGSLRKLNKGHIESLDNKEPNFVRQDREQRYLVNGAIFIALAFRLKEEETFHAEKVVPYFMKPSKSVDINTYDDLKIARALKREDS